MRSLFNSGRLKLYQLLRWSERYTKTDMVYLATHGFWLGGGQVITIGSAFLLSIAFANLLTPEAYGVYKYVFSIGALISIPTLAGIDRALVQSIAQHYDGSIAQSLKVKLRYGMLSTLASMMLASYYYFQGNQILALAIIIVGIFTPLAEAFGLYAAVLQGKKLFKTYSFYSSIAQLALTAVTLVLLIYSDNVLYLLLGHFLVSTTAHIFFFKKSYARADNSLTDPEGITLGKHLTVMDVFSTLAMSLDKILIFQYLGTAELALYVIAIAPPEQIKGLFKSMAAMVIPKFSQQEKSILKKTIFRKAATFAVGLTIIIAIYILSAPLLFNIFFPQYVAAILFSQIVAISIIPASISTFFYIFLVSHGRKQDLYSFNLFSNILNIILLLPAIYYFGIMGAILARVFIRILTMFHAMLIAKRM